MTFLAKHFVNFQLKLYWDFITCCRCCVRERIPFRLSYPFLDCGDAFLFEERRRIIFYIVVTRSG